MGIVDRLLTALRSRWRRPTFIEMLVILAFSAILVALIVPATQWASSGSIRYPVRVFVFDVGQRIPIHSAKVAVFRGSPTVTPEDLTASGQPFSQYRADYAMLSDVARGITGADGACVIEYEFRTGASHRRPTPYAHTNFAWVEVQADGYSTVVVPVRHASMPTKVLREEPVLFVPIGLAK